MRLYFEEALRRNVQDKGVRRNPQVSNDPIPKKMAQLKQEHIYLPRILMLQEVWQLKKESNNRKSSN